MLFPRYPAMWVRNGATREPQERRFRITALEEE